MIVVAALFFTVMSGFGTAGVQAYTDDVSNVRFETSAPTEIVIDLSHFRLHLIENGYLVKSYPIAAGAPGMLTPVAQWRVGEKSHRSFAAPMSARHMRLFRFNGQSYGFTGFAIHGTPWPWTIGTRASHGCVRMYNADAVDLYPRVPIGTIVRTLYLPDEYALRLWGNHDGRLWGRSAVSTSVAVSQEGWDTARVVILARNDHFSDALAATTLASSFQHDPAVNMPAPLILTDPDELSNEAIEEMRRLGAEIAIVLGGAGAVSETVLDGLRAQGITPDRLWQNSAYGTAADVARRVKSNSDVWGTFGQPDTAVVVSGEDFVDAMSASAPAGAAGMPILLTKREFLDPETEEALIELGIRNVIVVGGAAVVSEATVQKIREIGITVRRIAGADGAETAVKVASEGNIIFGFSRAYPVFIVRGDHFSDGLAVSALASRFRAPVLLTGSAGLPPATKSFLTVFRDRIADPFIIGGPGAISADVEAQAKRAVD